MDYIFKDFLDFYFVKFTELQLEIEECAKIIYGMEYSKEKVNKNRTKKNISKNNNIKTVFYKTKTK